MKRVLYFVLLMTFVVSPVLTYAQEDDQYVSREEYEKLKREVETLKARQPFSNMAEDDDDDDEGDDVEDLWEMMEDLEDEMAAVNTLAQSALPGTTKLLISGFASAGFTDKEDVDSSFSASFSSILLWKMSDKLLFETELEFSDEEVEMEYAHVSYLLNDYFTIGAGKFLTPFGTFGERVHPTWINKLPDAPMAFSHHGGIVPATSTGIQVRGGFPVGTTKWNYATYISNGPTLNTGDSDPSEAGELDFGNGFDSNNNKAWGGRIGFLPIPELELGYSWNIARVGHDDFFTRDVDAIIQGVDVSYKKDFDRLKGTIDARAEWVWSDVGTTSYDATGALGFGPVTFSNKRDGGYVQLAYRPSKVENTYMKNLEFVGRYDELNSPGNAPEAFDEQRWTIGVDYWVGPSTVVKFGYQFDNKDDPLNLVQDQNAFMFQIAIGF